MLSELSIHILTLVSFLTWLVFVITASKTYRFFKEFKKFREKNDVELNSMVWHSKKMEGLVSEILLEFRRSNKLLYDMQKSGEDVIVEYHDEDILRHNREGTSPESKQAAAMSKTKPPFVAVETEKAPPSVATDAFVATEPARASIVEELSPQVKHVHSIDASASETVEAGNKHLPEKDIAQLSPEEKRMLAKKALKENIPQHHEQTLPKFF